MAAAEQRLPPWRHPYEHVVAQPLALIVSSAERTVDEATYYCDYHWG